MTTVHAQGSTPGGDGAESELQMLLEEVTLLRMVQSRNAGLWKVMDDFMTGLSLDAMHLDLHNGGELVTDQCVSCRSITSLVHACLQAALAQ